MAWNPLRLGRNETPPTAILLIVLTAALTAALTSLVWWSARKPAPPAPPPPAPPPVINVAPDPKLTRADLIALAARAASAYGAGAPPPDQSAMVGRPFELRIAFRCGGPDLGWVRDDKQKSLKLTARLQDWTTSPVVLAAKPQATFDRVEGFWLPRPWIDVETCAAPPPPVPPALEADSGPAPEPKAAEAPAEPVAANPPPPQPQPQVLGLATFYSPASSRARQRGGKPYETVQKLSPEFEAADGADLYMIVQGRIDQATAGRPVLCQAPAPDRRPVCLVAVDIERVAFLHKDAVIAEWTR